MSMSPSVAAESAEPDPGVVMCPQCGSEPLELTQPSIRRPDRVIGTCPQCDVSYQMERCGPSPGCWRPSGLPVALAASA